MSDDFITGAQALRGQQKKPHLGVRAGATGASTGNEKLDRLNEGVCMRCGIFEADKIHAVFCNVCFALMDHGVGRIEALSRLGLTEEQAKKEVRWTGT